MTEIAQLPAPRLGEVIVAPTGAAEDLPTPTAPYYRLYKQGMYLHRPMAFGHGLIRHYKTPPALKEFEHAGGYFHFTGPRLPATIVSQAVSFFRRIWVEHRTEAEVIITQNWETGEHRLFVPTQWVSQGGVRSLYNPEHIAPKHLVIGTLHSHPGSAYHSGTDKNDASEMDGLHLTVGYLDREIPEFAAMVSMNKSFFDYHNPETVAELHDLTAAEAPAWWNRYMRFHAPTDAERPAFATDDDWDKIMGRYKKPAYVSSYTPAPRWVPQPQQLPATTQTDRTNHTAACLAWVGKNDVRDLTGDDWEAYLRQRPVDKTPKPKIDTSTWEDADWEMAERYGWIWDAGKQEFVHISQFENGAEVVAQRFMSEDLLPGGPRIDNDDDDDDVRTLGDFLEFYQDYWEDILGKAFVDGLYDTGLMQDEDIDAAIDAGDESFLPEFWERRMRLKLFKAVSWFRSQGYEVAVKLTPPQRPLPGQTEAFSETETKTGTHTELAPLKGAHI